MVFCLCVKVCSHTLKAHVYTYVQPQQPHVPQPVWVLAVPTHILFKWCQLCRFYLSFFLKIYSHYKFFHFSIFVKCFAFIDLRINFIKSNLKSTLKVMHVIKMYLNLYIAYNIFNPRFPTPNFWAIDFRQDTSFPKI